MLTWDEARTPVACEHCGAPLAPRILIAHIQHAVAAYYRIPIQSMFSTERVWELSHPRQLAMCLAHDLTKHSLPTIAQRFGGKHHTTVLFAIHAVEKRRHEFAETDLDYLVLREQLETSTVSPHTDARHDPQPVSAAA